MNSNIPKSEKYPISQILLVLSILNRGYSTCNEISLLSTFEKYLLSIWNAVRDMPFFNTPACQMKQMLSLPHS
jgi:hypothetical protein